MDKYFFFFVALSTLTCPYVCWLLQSLDHIVGRTAVKKFKRSCFSLNTPCSLAFCVISCGDFAGFIELYTIHVCHSWINLSIN